MEGCLELCRICLGKNLVDVPIFADSSGNSVSDKIGVCLPIKVNAEDALPKRICSDCNAKLDQQYVFWNTSVESDKKLREALGIVENPMYEKPTVSPSKNGAITKIKKERREADGAEPASKKPRKSYKRKSKSKHSMPIESDDESAVFKSTKQENDSEDGFNDSFNDSFDNHDAQEAGPSGVPKQGDALLDGTGNGDFYAPNASPPSSTSLNSNRLFNPLLHISNSPQSLNDGTHCDSSQTISEITSNSNEISNHNEDFSNFPVVAKADSEYKNFSQAIADKKLDSKCDQNLFATAFTSNYAPTLASSIGDDTPLSSASITDLDNFREKSDISLHTFEDMRKLSNRKRRELLQKQKKECLTSDGRYKCPKCDLIFETSFKIQYHIKSTHEERQHKCAVCFKAFLTAHHLKMHQAIHTDTKPYSCNSCSASFRYKKLLERHEIGAHMVKSDPAIAADDNAVMNNKNHENHVLLPYSCTQCAKGFSSRNAYIHHTKTHKLAEVSSKPSDIVTLEDYETKIDNVHLQPNDTDEKSRTKTLQCKVCNKEFLHKKYLQVHQRIHSGLKPYVCPTCGKAFTQASTLTVHSRYHTGEKPYTCTFCHKGFVTRTILLTHMKTH